MTHHTVQRLAGRKGAYSVRELTLFRVSFCLDDSRQLNQK